MEFINSSFKDVSSVVIKCEKFDATFLPENGGKLVSVKDKSNTEWLAQDKNYKYIPQTKDGVYIDAEVSGADEMFPTIDPCVVNGNSYPCHGEVCRISHRYYVDENNLVIQYHSNELKYDYKKIISENDDGSLNIKYEIKNNSDADFPCIWAFHMMFSSVDGGYAFACLPDDAHGEIMFDDTKRFGKREDVIVLKKEHFTNGKYQKDGDAYKYYITKPLENGICGYWRNDVKSCLKLTYDVKKLPYLGIWVNDGGFKEMYSTAVEPCNIPYDSIKNAKKHGYEFSIPSKAAFEFEINLSLDDIQ